MKRMKYIFILIGIVCFLGIIAISAESDILSQEVKTIGFIVLGYIGVISFSYGWLKKMKN